MKLMLTFFSKQITLLFVVIVIGGNGDNTWRRMSVVEDMNSGSCGGGESVCGNK